MEDNLRHQLETTFATCRRSPRILERTVLQTPPTVRKATTYEQQVFNSPEGIALFNDINVLEVNWGTN